MSKETCTNLNLKYFTAKTCEPHLSHHWEDAISLLVEAASLSTERLLSRAASPMDGLELLRLLCQHLPLPCPAR